jgi:putative NIF3 family GTP cyclohydrolase 1 type 2
MRASDVLEHFRSVGEWVDWEDTCDRFLHGDPDAEVRGIATVWIATRAAVERAAARGADLVITHEPLRLPGYHETASGQNLIRQKERLLDSLGITVLRCHDTWDRMPQVGIPDAWARWLGFEAEPRPTESFYRVCLLGDMALEDAARRVLERVRDLGQDTVLTLGDRRRRVRRMAVGTGAITWLPDMAALDVDLVLATDDGMNWWTGGPWAVEMEMPLLIVNHCTAEKPGMMAMAEYLREQFPDVPAEYVDVEFPYGHVCEGEPTQ